LLPRVFSERLLAGDQIHVLQTLERSGQRRHRFAQTRGDLGDPVAALTDQAQDRGRLGGVAHVVEQQARRLLEEDAQGAENEGANRGRQIRMIPCQLPITRRPTPDRIGLDGALGRLQVQRLFDPAGGQGRDLEDLAGAAEERRRAVEDEPLHHALGGAGQEEMDAAFALAVQNLLEQARQLRGDRDQGRKLIQRQHRPGPRLLPPARQEVVPAGIGDALEAGQKTADLGGQAGALQAPLAVVADIVDGPVGRQNLPQQPRLAAPPAAVDDPERALGTVEEAAESGGFFVAVEERELHGEGASRCRNYVAGTLCTCCIVSARLWWNLRPQLCYSQSHERAGF
jgi:hypothetical protein